MTAIRLSDGLRARVDAWAAEQEGEPSRSEAIRRLVEIGLESAPVGRRTSKKTAVKAAHLAGEMVDFLADPSATEEQRAKRKRRLLKGPTEFRDMRRDLSKR